MNPELAITETAMLDTDRLLIDCCGLKVFCKLWTKACDWQML
jgi:hypothetical protein